MVFVGTKEIVLFVLILFMFSWNGLFANGSSIIFVNKNATGANDGSSWENAFISIKEAIDSVPDWSGYYDTSTVSIWVAKGIYYEWDIHLKEGVHLYGGFDGTETRLSERGYIWSKLTTIDAQEQTRCIRCTHRNIIDGFELINGYRTEAMYQEDGLGYYGGGIYLEDNNVVIRNCLIKDCICERGAGIGIDGYGSKEYFDSTSPLIEFTVVTACSAYACAGGIEVRGSNATVRNCTIVDNVGFGLEIPYYPGEPNYVLGDFYNNIVVGHYNVNPRFTTPPEACDVWARARQCTHHSFVGEIWKAGSYWGSPFGRDNLYGDDDGLDPGFVDREGRDFRLLSTSPCIGTGQPQDDVPTDMGAFPYNMNRYRISGVVEYYSNNGKLKNVKIGIVSDSQNDSTITNLEGMYDFPDLMNGSNYSIMPLGYFADDDVISVDDAILVAKAVVGIINLSEHQRVAADVDNNGQINMYDALLMHRYVRELPNPLISHVGEWIFLPTFRDYTSLNTDYRGQNFLGIILGDVNGSWEMSE